MTPNVSVLLQRWGVDTVIGKNLVQFEELNMRRKDGTLVGHTKIPTLERSLGRPWWLVHRAHLHDGLATVAQSLGADIILDAQVTSIEYQPSETVRVETYSHQMYAFDLLVGADGINSITRKTLFPNVQPEPPTTNCAYRAIVPYDRIRQDPVARELIKKKTMEVWMAQNAYIITYPISDAKLFNLVLSHHLPEKLRATQHDVPIQELWDEYKDFDPRIKRIVNMIDTTVRADSNPWEMIHCTDVFLVSMAPYGHRAHELVVFSSKECRAHGRCRPLHGQPHGPRCGHVYGRRRIPR